MITIFDILMHLYSMENKSKTANPQRLKAHMKNMRFDFVNRVAYKDDVLMMFKCYDEIPSLNEGQFTSRKALHQQIHNAIVEIMTDPQGLSTSRRLL